MSKAVEHGKPLVSVIVPMRNAEAYVTATLESILQEMSLPLEIVIVDDGSTDSSTDCVRGVGDPRVRLIPGPCEGISAALNLGFEAAKGEILMRCDADDVYPPGRIAHQVNWLGRNPEFGAVCGNYSTIDSRGALVVRHDCGREATEITQELRNGVTRTHLCTFAIRSSFYRQLSGFRPYFKTAEDIDFQLRLGETCKVLYLPNSFLNYRLHDASVTHRKRSEEREFFDRMARVFQQQRLRQGADDLEKGCPPEPPLDDGTGATCRSAETHILNLLIGASWREYHQGNKLAALKLSLRAIRDYPTAGRAWRSLAALLFKSAGPRIHSPSQTE